MRNSRCDRFDTLANSHLQFDLKLLSPDVWAIDVTGAGVTYTCPFFLKMRYWEYELGINVRREEEDELQSPKKDHWVNEGREDSRVKLK